MIKRLKWNVLYAESAQDGADLSDSSAESVERGSATAQAVLDQLATNDPNFPTTFARQSHDSSSDEEETSQQHVSSQYPASTEQQQLPADSDDAHYAEWRECDLCPGKRFLNDAEVQAHLSSRRHIRALKRFEDRSTPESSDKPASSQGPVDADLRAFAGHNNLAEHEHFQTSSSPDLNDENLKKPSLSRRTRSVQQPDKVDQPNANEEPDIAEEQQRKADKRKADVKRRLRRLKQKKWDKKAQDEGIAETSTNQEEKQTLTKIISENRQRTERKREKVGKVRNRREKQRVQNPSDLDKHGGNEAESEVSPASPTWEHQKGTKRKGKETLRENKLDGSTKRKKLRKGREAVASGGKR